MKKVIGILLAVCMIAAVTACGTTGTETTTATVGETTQSKEETTTAKKADTGSLNEGFKATIEETVLVDEAGVKITATELECTSYSVELKLKLENNTEQELQFLAGTIGCPVAYVNDYMISGGYLNETVAPGMTANEDISFTVDELAMYGIKEIGKIGIAFEIQADNDDYLETGVVEIRTSEDANYDYSKDTFMEAMDGEVLSAKYGYTTNYRTDEKLFDNEGLSMLCAYVITNKDGEQTLIMEVQNSSDEDRVARTENVNVNRIGVCASTWDSNYIVAGKRALVYLCFDDLLDREYLELLGMEKYGNISFDLEAANADYDTLGISPMDIVFDGEICPDNYSGEVLYDNNGIKFMKVGICEDPSEYSDSVHAIFLVKNEGSEDVIIDTDYDGVYANSIKVNDITYLQQPHPNGYALMDVELMGYDLEDNGLDFDSITDVMVTFEVWNGDYYDILDTPMVTMTK